MITQEQENIVREYALAYIADMHTFCRYTEFVTEVSVFCYKRAERIEIESDDLVRIIDSLVQEGKLVELEYVLPTTDYKVSSLLFPQGTRFPQMEIMCRALRDEKSGYLSEQETQVCLQKCVSACSCQEDYGDIDN